jgi:hypothetical protein
LESGKELYEDGHALVHVHAIDARGAGGDQGDEVGGREGDAVELRLLIHGGRVDVRGDDQVASAKEAEDRSEGNAVTVDEVRPMPDRRPEATRQQTREVILLVSPPHTRQSRHCEEMRDVAKEGGREREENERGRRMREGGGGPVVAYITPPMFSSTTSLPFSLSPMAASQNTHQLWNAFKIAVFLSLAANTSKTKAPFGKT